MNTATKLAAVNDTASVAMVQSTVGRLNGVELGGGFGGCGVVAAP